MPLRWYRYQAWREESMRRSLYDAAHDERPSEEPWRGVWEETAVLFERGGLAALGEVDELWTKTDHEEHLGSVPTCAPELDVDELKRLIAREPGLLRSDVARVLAVLAHPHPLSIDR